MIDPEKFEGTPDTFHPERIRRLEKEGIINSVASIEKAIFALEFLSSKKDVRQAGIKMVKF